jgi:hypothetical protein
MINAKVDPNAISLPPGTVVGYRGDGRPIYNIAGGAVNFEGTDDADDDDTGSETDDDDDDDDDDSQDDDWTPPSKEAWEKLIAEKKKVDSESAQRKRLLREAGINPKDGKPLKTTPKLPSLTDDEDDDSGSSKNSDSKESDRTPKDAFDAKALEKRLQREMERNLLDQEKEVRNEERTRARTLMSAIPEALNSEGWNGKAMPRILKLLDLDAIEVDEDGIDGLEDQITELKNDFPEFFRRTRMKEAAEKVADRKTAGGGTKKTSPAKQEGTWAENIARALHGEG